jgi:hypothetical protein
VRSPLGTAIRGKALKFTVVDLGRDYPGRISDFADARNSFIKDLPNGEYVLFVDSDEEAPKMLLDHISSLKPQFPYYWVRRIELVNNKYVPVFNPNYNGKLCSNKIRFIGRVHEMITPREPHGVIDIPIIHNHSGLASYSGGAQSMIKLGLLKVREVVRGW